MASFDFTPIETTHIAAVNQMYKNYSGCDVTDELQDYLSEFPSCAIWDNEKLIAFAYSRSFAPDILELFNILVLGDYQSHALGSQLVESIERQAKGKGFKAIVAVNSDLSPCLGVKRSAAKFYIRHGYQLVIDTEHSRVFSKELA